MRKDIPLYQCHKQVRAFEIGKVENGVVYPLKEDAHDPVHLETSFIESHYNGEPSYLVIYEGGYMSFSPKNAFEEGYSQLPDPDGEPTTQVLMSRGNKGGFTLEGLLDIIISDIEFKTSLIKDKTGITEQSIIQHNQVVIGHLTCAAATHRLTYVKLLDDKGVNKGVDTPRI